MRPLRAVITAALVALMPLDVAAENRIALVIGNADYADAPLLNPVNDARAMAEKLAALGFEVVASVNASKADMEQAIADFSARLHPNAVALAYFSGHGVQVDGTNFLIPVDATISTRAEIWLRAIDLTVLLRQMEARSRLSIVILDACRNNPFLGTRGSRGLAQMQAPTGSLIAYATAPGKVASDGEGEHGLYTGELLAAMDQPGLLVEQVFKEVRQRVTSLSGGQQVPWESSSLVGDFRFVPEESEIATSNAPTMPAPNADREALFWESIKDATDPAAFGAYLDRYPDGVFAPLAQLKMDTLDAPTVPMPRAAPPKPKPEPEPALELKPEVAAASAAPTPTTVDPPPFPDLSERELPLNEARARQPQKVARRVMGAARRGDVRAQAVLGVLYQRGIGVARDPAAAQRWYRTAAERGHPLGQLGLGNLHRIGLGARRDPALAVHWFKRAADQGHPLGHTALGFMLRDGEGTTADAAAAARHFRLAADRGIAVAQAALGWHFETGRGVARDLPAARSWYRQAATKGNAYARERLSALGP